MIANALAGLLFVASMAALMGTYLFIASKVWPYEPPRKDRT